MTAPMLLTRAAFLDLASVQVEDLNLNPLTSVVPYWSWYDRANDAELTEVLPEVEILVSNKIVLGEQAFKQAAKLKLVCVAATGYNNIDIEAATRHGITVCNVTGYATESVVQHVFALLLSLTTHLNEVQVEVKNDRWSRSRFFCLFGQPVSELQGKTLGIVGYGELGRAVASVAKAFGMNIVIAARDENDTRPERLALNELLSRVDVLSLHCPFTETNRHLIGEAELGLMKPDALLINTARGGLVDEQALLKALKEKQIAGAALDVLENEPPEAGHALIHSGLDNLIITPHVAWVSRESRQRLINGIAKNIAAFNEGKPTNVVSG